MKVVHGTIEGPFSAEEDIVIHGMITAGATLREGVKLILHGMITGNLVIDADFSHFRQFQVIL